MFAPWAGLLTLVAAPLLMGWAVWQRRWAVAGLSLCVVVLPFVWTWFFPLDSWFTNDWETAGTDSSQGSTLMLLSLPLSWLVVGLSGGLLLWALARRTDGWPALLLLLTALVALLHVWPLFAGLWHSGFPS